MFGSSRQSFHACPHVYSPCPWQPERRLSPKVRPFFDNTSSFLRHDSAAAFRRSGPVRPRFSLHSSSCKQCPPPRAAPPPPPALRSSVHVRPSARPSARSVFLWQIRNESKGKWCHMAQNGFFVSSTTAPVEGVHIDPRHSVVGLLNFINFLFMQQPIRQSLQVTLHIR